SLWQKVTFFFFQAEDGIRDLTVTGVQTCALPIYLVAAPMDLGHHVGPPLGRPPRDEERRRDPVSVEEVEDQRHADLRSVGALGRSEERRVGKECRSRRVSRQRRRKSMGMW